MHAIYYKLPPNKQQINVFGWRTNTQTHTQCLYFIPVPSIDCKIKIVDFLRPMLRY
jgi:hypothetical protein